jgi:hypothetical protein
MPEELAPKPVDLCLVADAVLREAKFGRLPSEFLDVHVNQAVNFLIWMGYGPDLKDMAYKASKLKGGGPPP